MGGQLAELIAGLEEEKTLSFVGESVDAGRDPLSLVEECRAGMSQVGERYERGEYFLSDLVMSSEIFKNAIALIEPHLPGGLAASSTGQAVVGTAQGDIHDIGKNIVAAMLRCSGFEVHDLGVDVQLQAFVEKVTVEKLLADGIMPFLHFDNDWTSYLHYLKDLPAARCILHLDGFSDILKAKEVLGDHICLMEDVPPALLSLGTPEQVTQYCSKLIDQVGLGGGFILAQGCTVPADAKFENVRAMVEAAEIYGRYN